jgi:hypothetical protein
MIKIILGLMAFLVATSPGAQDDLTDEQQAAKCAAEGGCAIFSRDEIVQLMQLAYKKGLRACNTDI